MRSEGVPITYPGLANETGDLSLPVGSTRLSALVSLAREEM
jgi:hypothetical protein